MFVHGALCVAYSGQCLTSESLGGRSANRGQCAQACRLPYDLVCDGQDVDLGDVKYLLSPQDLAAYALVPELIDAGVSSFKIEGRLKTPEYVANITRHYRRALDAAAADRAADFTEQDVTEMELSFSRGFSPGWLGGCDHKMLVPGLSSAKRGVLVGEVKAVRGRSVVVAARRPVAPGDGVVFAGNREEGDEQGGRVYEVTPRGGSDIELAFGHDAIDFARLAPGQQLWKTDDPQLTAKLRKIVHRREAAAASGAGSRRACRGRRDAANHRAGRQRRELRRANRRNRLPRRTSIRSPNEVLEQQLGRLGGTVYELRNLRAEIVGEPMVPLSVLGKLRHQMIEQLARSSASRPTRRILTSSDHRTPRQSRELACIGRTADVASALPHARSTDGRGTIRHQQSDRRLPGHSRVSGRGRSSEPAWRDDLSRDAAHSKAWRSGHLPRDGQARRERLPRAQPGRHGVLRGARHSVRLRFLAQCRQPVDGRLPAIPRRRARDRFLRLEPRSTARSRRRGAARVAGSRHSSAHADVPHGALRVLRRPLAGHEQTPTAAGRAMFTP